MYKREDPWVAEGKEQTVISGSGPFWTASGRSAGEPRWMRNNAETVVVYDSEVNPAHGQVECYVSRPFKQTMDSENPVTKAF